MNNHRSGYGQHQHHASSEYSDVFGAAPSRNPNPGRGGFQKKPAGRRNAPKNNNQGFSRLPPHVAELRALMQEQGVLVVTYICDTDTRALLSTVHLESRGLMLPQNGKALHSQIVSAAREFYEIALQDIPDIEIKDLNRLLKQDIEKLLKELLGRIPCVMILIHTL